MTERDRVIAFWRGKKAARISYPAHRGRWPDRDTQDILRKLCVGMVCEVGCGVGRCSDAFVPDRYIGVDINPEAIEIAAKECPNHMFQSISWDSRYPLADTYLFYTTLQHVPDDEIHGVLVRCKNRIVIQEHMLREYRDEARLRFHRTHDEYRGALAAAGFEETNFEEHPTKYQTGRRDRPPLVRRFLVAEER